MLHIRFRTVLLMFNDLFVVPCLQVTVVIYVVGVWICFKGFDGTNRRKAKVLDQYLLEIAEFCSPTGRCLLVKCGITSNEK